MSDFGHTISNSRNESHGHVKVVSGASPHLKGAWTQLTGTISFEYDKITLFFATDASAAFLFDIAVGTLSTGYIYLENVPLCTDGSTADINIPSYITIPLRVREGLTILARTQSNESNSQMSFGVVGYGREFASPISCSHAVSYGADTVNTKGTDIVLPALANTFGAWTEIVASTDFTHRWLMLFAVADWNNGAAGLLNFVFEVGIGGAGGETSLLRNLYFSRGVYEENPSVLGIYPVDIPSGSRLLVRQMVSNVISDAETSVVMIGAA